MVSEPIICFVKVNLVRQNSLFVPNDFSNPDMLSVPLLMLIFCVLLINQSKFGSPKIMWFLSLKCYWHLLSGTPSSEKHDNSSLLNDGYLHHNHKNIEGYDAATSFILEENA